MFGFSYKKIYNLVGPLLTIDNGHKKGFVLRPHIYNHKYLSIGFGCINGIIPLEIIIDSDHNIIDIKVTVHENEPLRNNIIKLTNKLKGTLKLKNVIIESLIDKLFIIGFDKQPLNLNFMSTEKLTQLHEAVALLDWEYKKRHKYDRNNTYIREE